MMKGDAPHPTGRLEMRIVIFTFLPRQYTASVLPRHLPRLTEFRDAQYIPVIAVLEKMFSQLALLNESQLCE